MTTSTKPPTTTLETQELEPATWTDEVPANANAGDAYYFVRRKDRLDVVIMGFSMGKGWLNGVSYEPSEMRNHLFLGPITPTLFDEVTRLREALGLAAKRLGFLTNWLENTYHGDAADVALGRKYMEGARAALQPKAEG